MRKLIFILLSLAFLTSCKKEIYKFKPKDRQIFEQFKIDITSMQLYSPQHKCFLITLDAETVMNNISPKTCRIETLSDIAYTSLYLKPLTKLTCVKIEKNDLYVSFDDSYPPLIFREGLDGYYLLTDNDGYTTIGGKTYLCTGKLYLMTKGRFATGKYKKLIRLKGNSPKCK